ncbi:hypothetical protein LINPERHAP1_LOCUS30847 [Linum perenne]
MCLRFVAIIWPAMPACTVVHHTEQ